MELQTNLLHLWKWTNGDPYWQITYRWNELQMLYWWQPKLKELTGTLAWVGSTSFPSDAYQVPSSMLISWGPVFNLHERHFKPSQSDFWCMGAYVCTGTCLVILVIALMCQAECVYVLCICLCLCIKNCWFARLKKTDFPVFKARYLLWGWRDWCIRKLALIISWGPHTCFSHTLCVLLCPFRTPIKMS